MIRLEGHALSRTSIAADLFITLLYTTVESLTRRLARSCETPGSSSDRSPPPTLNGWNRGAEPGPNQTSRSLLPRQV